jgi:hypothetical protein
LFAGGGSGNAATTPATLQASPLFEHPQSAEQLLRTVLQTPAAELVQARALSGEFIQSRSLVGLARPLVSSGEFLLAREFGVHWHTRTPFESDMVLTESGMTLRDSPESGPGAATRVDAQEQPALRVVLNILMAMFTLDVRGLEESFELYGLAAEDGEAGRWQVGLKPRQAVLQSVFRAVVIAGARHVERIELVDGNGDRTEIAFAGIRVRTTPLDDEMLRRFQ